MKKTFKVNFQITKTYSGDFEEDIEIDIGKKATDNAIEEELLKNIDSSSYDAMDLDLDDGEITIDSFEEISTLEPMTPKECLKCEICKNFCQKCIYFQRNKCSGNFNNKE